jgi:hypothetical protein
LSGFRRRATEFDRARSSERRTARGGSITPDNQVLAVDLLPATAGNTWQFLGSAGNAADAFAPLSPSTLKPRGISPSSLTIATATSS